MAVTFVYRSHYDDPSGKRVRRFPDATVLDWFRNHWAELRDNHTYVLLESLLGFQIYGFNSLFEAANEVDLPAPADERQLAEYLAARLYSEGPILAEPHCITVKTDDDELEVCYHIFDDVFLAGAGARAAYLLNDGWRLPAEHLEEGTFEPAEPTTSDDPAGDGRGTTYLVFLAYQDSCNLSDLEPADRIEGVRLPDLVPYLARGNGHHHDVYLMLLRSQLFAAPLTDDPLEEGFRREMLENPEDEATWCAYSDWFQERHSRPAGIALLEEAMRATTHIPVSGLPYDAWKILDRDVPIAKARADLQRALTSAKASRWLLDPSKSRIQVEEHMAQL
jgi:uncharacterized protein (TIGR02996 family)